MPNTGYCPRCGAELAPGASPAGLCPACLLRGALEDSGDSEAYDEANVKGLAAGSTLGPFRIIELLGKGGMASVYKAYEADLDRSVALKVLPAAFLHDDTFAKRFHREGKVIARLEHPNIIPIYASGIDGGTPWMSMRLLAGGSLATVLKRERLSCEQVLKILQDVADALDHAHQLGVIHRDVKPSNILLDRAERVCVADFGLAHVVERSLVLTRTGITAGTPQYMAPEQALAKEVDHRSDIYALGVVAYEMLTGRVPFTGDTPVAILMRHVNEMPAPPRSFDPDIPEAVDQVILKSLQKHREERHATAGEMVAALQTAISERRPAVVPVGQRTTIPVGNQAGLATTRLDRPAPEPRPAGSKRWAFILAASTAMVAAIALFVAVHQTGIFERLPGIEGPTAVAPGSEDEAPPPRGDPAEVTRQSPPPAGAPPDRASSEDTPARSAAAPPGPVVDEPRQEPAPEPGFDPDDPGGVERERADRFLGPFGRELPERPPPPPPPTGPGRRVEQDTPPPAGDTDPARSAPAGTATPPEPVHVGDERLLERIKHVQPDYPPILRAAGRQGVVIVRATVAPDGKVASVEVEKSVHPLFDEAAKEAVVQYEYKPYVESGVPVSFIVDVEVKFELK